MEEKTESVIKLENYIERKRLEINLVESDMALSNFSFVTRIKELKDEKERLQNELSKQN